MWKFNKKKNYQIINWLHYVPSLSGRTKQIRFFFSFVLSQYHIDAGLSERQKSRMDVLSCDIWHCGRWRAELAEFSASDTSSLRMKEANKNNRRHTITTTTSTPMKHTQNKNKHTKCSMRVSLFQLVVSVQLMWISLVLNTLKIRKRKNRGKSK